MKIKFFLLLLLFVIATSSCSEDIVETGTGGQFEAKSMLQNYPVINSLDELDALFGYEKTMEADVLEGMSVPLTKADLVTLSVTGFTRKYNYKPEQKMSFTPNAANMIGVQPYTVYLVSLDRYEKDIKTEGKMLFGVDSPQCGAKPVMGNYNEEVSDFDNLGYRIQNTGNVTTLSTHLYYVNCAFPAGTAIKKYYPRSAESLIWNYILF